MKNMGPPRLSLLFRTGDLLDSEPCSSTRCHNH